MSKPEKTFIAICLCCLIIFLLVQYKLVYNTYELKEKQYNIEEKKLIKDIYSNSIQNDKVYPGGQRIMDRFINHNMNLLERLYSTDPKSFRIKSQLICDSMFASLRAESNMDSLFNYIVSTNNLSGNLNYLLTIEDVSITFDGKHYIDLYNYSRKKKYTLIPDSIQSSIGIIIGGKLKKGDSQNLSSAITVSQPSARSYRTSFSLYADKNNRTAAIFGAMAPTFILSVSSIVFVIGVFYFTYSNWLKQKKLAEMKSDFLNSITHEFNTPISAILVANRSLLNTEIIARKENIFSLAEVINRQANRLKTLISQALDITAMPKREIEKENLKISPFLEEIINDYRLKAGPNILIKHISDNTEIKIAVNRFLFTTMLYNIFDNAVKYNTSEVKKINIRTFLSNQNFAISIKDNGIGMSEKITSQVFDKFFRGANKTQSSGLGLGLFYVKQAIEVHKWNIKLNTSEGEGSDFIIFIPAAHLF